MKGLTANMQINEQQQKEIQRLKSAVAELTVLNELALAAGSTFDENEMLDIIVRKSVKAVKAEQGSILLVTEKKDDPLKTLIRRNDLSSPMQTYRVGTHITGWVLKNKEPLIIENLSEDSRFNTTKEDRMGIQTVLAVPIWHRSQIIGILMVTNKKTDEPFGPDDLRLLSIISAQSGQLIRNSQLQGEAIEKKRLEHELGLAHKMQMDLLPQKDPEISGLDIASYFNPTESVGGDYYDYFDLGDNKLGIIIADVCGHGPAAALMMTMIKGIAHSISSDYNSADAALHKLNSIINDIIPEDIFITMQFLVFDTKKKVMHFSNAGHNPLIHYKAESGSIEEVVLRGPAINLMENGIFNIQEIPLVADDIFLIYTDGITEGTNEKREMFKTDGLKKVVEKSVQDDASQIIERIKSQFDLFRGNAEQDDDVAMIVIKMQ